MERPELKEIPVDGVFDGSSVIITMSRGQWDDFLQAAYNNGIILLEVDENEIPVKAYRRPDEV